MIFDTYTIIILVFAFIFILWWGLALGAMFPMIGNGDDFSSYNDSHVWGMILGVGVLGCLALGFGSMALSIYWLDKETVPTVTLVASVLAIGASVSALSIGAISRP